MDPASGELAEGATGESRRATINDDIAPDELTPEKARELLEAAADDGRVLGHDPETGRDIVAKAGRYGPYVTEVLPEEVANLKGKAKVKPRTASLFKDMSLASVDLDDALRLLSLPRVVGNDPESGDEITAQNGRYGPYLKKGTDSRSLQTEDQLFTVTLEEALAVYAQPKQRGQGRGGTAASELGDDPVSGKPMVVKEGRFGAYVTDGETNATLRKDDEPRVDHARARRRAAGREARPWPGDPQAGHQEGGQEGHHQEGRGQEDDGQEDHRQEDRLTLPAPRRTARVPARGARRTTSRAALRRTARRRRRDRPGRAGWPSLLG